MIIFISPWVGHVDLNILYWDQYATKKFIAHSQLGHFSYYLNFGKMRDHVKWGFCDSGFAPWDNFNDLHNHSKTFSFFTNSIIVFHGDLKSSIFTSWDEAFFGKKLEKTKPAKWLHIMWFYFTSFLFLLWHSSHLQNVLRSIIHAFR